MRPERRLINAVHRHLPKSLHRQSMTMGSLTQNGTPDYFYDGAGRDLWIEYKALTAMPRNGIVFGAYTELQRRWMTRRWQHGKNAIGLVGLPNETAVLQLAPYAWEHGTPVSGALPIKDIALWISNFCGCSFDQPPQ